MNFKFVMWPNTMICIPLFQQKQIFFNSLYFLSLHKMNRCLDLQLENANLFFHLLERFLSSLHLSFLYLATSYVSDRHSWETILLDYLFSLAHTALQYNQQRLPPSTQQLLTLLFFLKKEISSSSAIRASLYLPAFLHFVQSALLHIFKHKSYTIIWKSLCLQQTAA